MKKSLLDVMFMSEKRKGVLLLLQDGAKEMEYLLKSLGTTRQALLPQIRILEEHHLISHQRDVSELTTIGKLVVDEMLPLLETVETFNGDIDYWGTRDLDFIPPYLLKRMNELRNCEVIKPPTREMYELNNKITSSCYTSDSVNMIAAYFHPDYPALFSEMANRNVNVNAIFSKDLLDHLQKDYYNFLEKMIRGKSFNIYVHPQRLDFLALVVNDHYNLLRIIKNNGEIDGQYIMCSNPAALGWGNELFRYYLKGSMLLTDI